jgi:hypoxanthine phosphoribosyltransferase
MPAHPYDYSTRKGIQSVSWEQFHGLCKSLAVAAADFQPEIILPIGRGGYYPGTLLAHILQAEIYPVRLSRRVNDEVKYMRPRWIIEPPAAIAGSRVLIVDEVCSSGETISMMKEKVAQLAASQARSAVLYSHTWGAHVPDYIGLITDALVLNPWDREILEDGSFRFHPEYAQAMAHQGLKAGPQWLIATPEIKLAKG